MSSTDALTRQTQSRPKSGAAMMRMTIAVAALIVVVTTMLRSRSSSIELSTAAKPPLQELHTMAGDAFLFQDFCCLNFYASRSEVRALIFARDERSQVPCVVLLRG